jgi:hypothetical protein
VTAGGPVPDARGTYAVSGQGTDSNCANPIDNGSVPISGELRITSQTGANFSGSATLFNSHDGNVDRIEVTLNGTINAAGQFSETFKFMNFRNNVLKNSGSETFSGSLAGNVITLTVTPQGGTCTTVVSLSGSR